MRLFNPRLPSFEDVDVALKTFEDIKGYKEPKTLIDYVSKYSKADGVKKYKGLRKFI